MTFTFQSYAKICYCGTTDLQIGKMVLLQWSILCQPPPSPLQPRVCKKLLDSPSFWELLRKAKSSVLLMNSQWWLASKHINVVIQLLSIRFLVWSCPIFYRLPSVAIFILCMWISSFLKYLGYWDTAAPIFVTGLENRTLSILNMRILRHKIPWGYTAGSW
jgi:hypothetical protein